MIMTRTRKSLSTTVSPITFEMIQQTAIELDCCHSMAIDRIVQEWAENAKRQPLKNSLSLGDWDTIQNTLDNIETRLNWIEGALVDRV